MTHLSSLDNFKHIYREFQYQKPNGTYKNCFQDLITRVSKQNSNYIRDISQLGS